MQAADKPSLVRQVPDPVVRPEGSGGRRDRRSWSHQQL